MTIDWEGYRLDNGLRERVLEFFKNSPHDASVGGDGSLHIEVKYRKGMDMSDFYTFGEGIVMLKRRAGGSLSEAQTLFVPSKVGFSERGFYVQRNEDSLVDRISIPRVRVNGSCYETGVIHRD